MMFVGVFKVWRHCWTFSYSVLCPGGQKREGGGEGVEDGATAMEQSWV